MNQKVKNATPEVYEDIKFKSKVEIMMYKTLIKLGFNPEYETHKYILWKGFKPTVPYYTRNKRGINILESKKLIDITYTPDFYMEYEGLKIIIEVKGKENDVFPYKFKMFREVIENQPDKEDYMIFQVFTKRQLLECIEIIKAYASNRKNEEIIE